MLWSEERAAALRTEEPTPRRLRAARREGLVGRSRDLAGAAALLGGVSALAMLAPLAWGQLAGFLRAALAGAFAEPADGGAGALATAMGVAARAAGPVLAAAMLTALVVGAIQTGGLFTLSPLRPRLARVGAWRGLVRIAGQGGFELAKACLLMAGLAAVAVATVREHVRELALLGSAPARAALSTVGLLARQLLLRSALVVVAVALLDLVWQRRAFRRGLRMSRAEVERERKEEEGDPRHRAQRRRLHRELLRRRALLGPLGADCVVAGEGQAVALRYQRATMAAPCVLAGGAGLIGARLLDLARVERTPIVVDASTARALAALDSDDEIPEALYDPVARALHLSQSRRP